MADNFHNPFAKFLQNFKTYTGRLPLRISQRALLEIKSNFSRQGYDSDSGFKPWAARKVNKGAKRALLIKSGRLRRSLRAAPLPNMPRVVTDVPYAEALNSGFRGTQNVRAHKRVATRSTRIKGSFSGLGSEKGKGKKVKITGARHNVKGFSRKVNMEARPFMTVGPAFLDREEAKLLDELENLFLQA